MTEEKQPKNYTPPALEATEKRKLTEDEVSLAKSRQENIKDLIAKWDWDVETLERNLEKGFDLEVKAKKVTAKQRINELKREVTNMKKNFEIIEDQIQNGVVVKKNVPRK